MMMAGTGKKAKSQSRYLRKGIPTRNKLGSAIGESDRFLWRLSEMDDWLLNENSKEKTLDWNDKDGMHVAKIMKCMKELERRGWKELINDDKKNHHFIPVERMCSKARSRWKEIYWEKRRFDATSLFSLKIDKKKRLFGVRDGGVFIVIWYDPYHQICPSAKKNT